MCVFERNHLTVTENQVRFLPFLESPKVPSIIEDMRELLVLLELAVRFHSLLELGPCILVGHWRGHNGPRRWGRERTVR